jgi:prepilin-type processing-associated H-X9-DG protein
MEVVLAAAILGGGLLALGAVKQQANDNLAKTTAKMKDLGAAFIAFADDHGGVLPDPDVRGRDDWAGAAKPNGKNAWYNALPPRLKAKSIAEIGKVDREAYYQDDYPLYLPGAPYPQGEKRLDRPYFAVGMNSRLNPRNEQGAPGRITLGAIMDPMQTILLLERGMPGDDKHIEGQRGFSADPKASATAFVARHNGRGVLLFVDAHLELAQPDDLLDERGEARIPQKKYIWTADPADDPRENIAPPDDA